MATQATIPKSAPVRRPATKLDSPQFLNPRGIELGLFNCVLSGTSSNHYVPEYVTPLSIKTMVAGSAIWETPARRYVVHENTYLVLNDGQTYMLTIDSFKKATTFCIFFEHGFVEEVHRAMRSASDTQLDEPHAFHRPRMDFHERLEPRPSPVLAATSVFHRALSCGRLSRTAAEESFLRIAETLLKQHRRELAATNNFPAQRPATREELLRRVSRGRDYILSSLSERVTLADAARAACLSPYHFLRAFRHAFGATPHQFLTRQRLDRARFLLARGDRSVTDVCLESGFESLGSFSSLFRRHFGVSPQQVQRGAQARNLDA
ncbi:MAG TPA: AraC family transcriptional regulator [Candidatus Limnocylindrales bacterium]|nr:AraC family transcriptional regulator [Candidatus Limnocylindrales bacterium]